MAKTTEWQIEVGFVGGEVKTITGITEVSKSRLIDQYHSPKWETLCFEGLHFRKSHVLWIEATPYTIER